MKNIILLLAVTWFGGTAILAQTSNADKVLGVWLTEDKDGKIEIFKSGEKYFGRLLWGTKIFAADGKTSLKDDKNPDPQLRARELKNLVMMTDFIYGDGEWAGGKIYDSTTGKTYSCSMRLKDGKLYVRGYIGISLLGKTVVWTRVQ